MIGLSWFEVAAGVVAVRCNGAAAMGAVGGRSGGRARGSGGDVLAGGGRAEGRDRAGQREGALVECDRPELRMRGARDPERRRARAARGCPPRCRVAQLTHRVCATATQLLPKARGRGRVAIGGGWRGEGSRKRIGASAARAAKQIGNLIKDT